jgi:hypothetical protein
VNPLDQEASRGLRIALLPLDERPVNTRLPRDVAAIAGATLMMPPAEMLPQLRRPGRPDALCDWLIDAAAQADAVVASIDTMCFGGLIAARTSTDSTAKAIGRLDVLRALRQRQPDLPIAAVSLVMRASDSYSAQEEPDYWARHGRELHRLGGLHHRAFLRSDDSAAADLRALRAQLPADIVLDFERRRLRNHQVNLHALSQAADGVVDPLLITADDTAEFAAGSLEQLWLALWADILPMQSAVLMYPGADEVGAVLVARQLADLLGGKASFRLECADPAGLERVPNFENGPLRLAIERQVRAAGAALGDVGASMALLVHPPDPGRRDLCGSIPAFHADDRAEAEKTAALAGELIEAGRDVALADLRYSNGGDSLLIEALQARGLVGKLAAYGGWNTAGNALGSVIAAGTAIQLAQSAGILDRGAARRLLLHRLLEDYGYQAVARRPYGAGLMSFDDASESAAAQALTAELSAIASALGGPGVAVADVRFPWHRSFEIDFAISGEPA